MSSLWERVCRGSVRISVVPSLRKGWLPYVSVKGVFACVGRCAG